MKTKTSKAKVQIDITVDERNKTGRVEKKFDGSNLLIVAGLLDALSDVFSEKVKPPVEDGINELCELLSKEIKKKASKKTM